MLQVVFDFLGGLFGIVAGLTIGSIITLFFFWLASSKPKPNFFRFLVQFITGRYEE